MRFLALLVACLAAGAQTTGNAALNYFTDTVLVDQNGVERRFYSDLIKDKVVIINAIFASCKDSCPVMSKTFARIQDELGSRLDKQVMMLSISVDPENDTPAVLKAYAQDAKAKPGWYFLTGKK